MSLITYPILSRPTCSHFMIDTVTNFSICCPRPVCVSEEDPEDPLKAARLLWDAKSQSSAEPSTSPPTKEQESLHTTPHKKAHQPHARLRLHLTCYSLIQTQDTTLSLRMSSIEHDHERETAEASADQTAIADGSVGSDTETSKIFITDPAIKDPSEGPYHARSNSIAKKPSTFKAVSVTKNFLAKAGTTAAPAVKGTGDNGRLHLNSYVMHDSCSHLRQF